MPVLWEGGDRQKYGEAPPPVLQGVGPRGGGPDRGQRPEEGEARDWEKSGTESEGKGAALVLDATGAR